MDYPKLHKTLHKAGTYLRKSFPLLFPTWLYVHQGPLIRYQLSKLPLAQKQQLFERRDYYCQLEVPFGLPATAQSLSEFSRAGASLAYYMDLREYLRPWRGDYAFDYDFSDVNYVCLSPTLVKSRPIGPSSANNVLLKLNSIRHYYVFPDVKGFRDKADCVVWRGDAHNQNRLNFVKNYCERDGFDVGDVNKRSIGKPYYREFLSISEQLNNRFVMSIEGNDVATNLKWITASNSVCVMPKPRYETWFMEGRLEAGVHYIQVADDFHNIEEVLEPYRRSPEKAELIVKNAHEYWKQFHDQKSERLLTYLVLEKYFRLAG